MKDAEFLLASQPYRRALNAIFVMRQQCLPRWSSDTPDQRVRDAMERIERHLMSNSPEDLADKR